MTTEDSKALVIINRLEREKGLFQSDKEIVLRRYPLTFRVIGRQATQIERLRTAGDQMLTAFAEGTNWTPEKRAAYEAMNAALGDSHD